MKKIKENKGFTLVELIIVIAIIALLVGLIAPAIIGFLHTSAKTAVEAEASQFIKGARVAYVQTITEGKKPGNDAVKWKVSPTTSPFYRSGALYGTITNWSVKNGPVTTASNATLCENFFNAMGIVYGKGWDKDGVLIPMSATEPKDNGGGSMNDECVFQLFYDEDGFIFVEYSRNGYFVRMNGNAVVESIRLAKSSDAKFTKFIK